MQRAWLIALFAGSIVLATAGSGLARVRVAELGDPSDFVFEGVASFPVEQVRRELAGDFDFLLAAHPNAPMQPMLDAIERKLMLGYRANGFPHVKIEARYEAAGDRIIVRVSEGSQYLRGEIRFVGAENVETAPIIERLTQRHVALPALPTSGGEAWPLPSVIRAGAIQKGSKASNNTTAPLWEVGKPAGFDGQSNQWIAGKVKEALSLQGYFFPEVAVSVELDDESRTGVLTVTIRDAGPRAVLGEIEVRGAEKHTADEILAFVGLRPGMLFNMSVHAAVERRLWDSGRFLYHEAALVPPKAADDPVRLQLQLREYADAAPLGEEFSPIEKIMLKLGDWLSEWADSDEDMLITASAAHLPKVGDTDGSSGLLFSGELIFSPRNGLFVDVTLNDPDEKTVFRQSYCQTKSRFVWVSPTRATKFDVRSSTSKSPSLIVNFIGVPENPAGTKMNGSFGIRFNSSSEQSDGQEVSPAPLQFLFAPVVGLTWAHFENFEYKMEDDVLHIVRDMIEIQIDVHTGRILQCRGEDPSKGAEFELRFAPQVLRQRLQALDQETAGYTNAYDSRAAFSSAFRFVLEEGVHINSFANTGDKPDTKNVLQELLTRRVLRHIDAMAGSDAPSSSEQQDFSIPAGLPEAEQQQNFSMEMIARGVLPYYSQLFPRDSPPWIAGREFAFLISGRAKYADQEFKKILNSHYTGPVTHLYVGSLLRFLNPHAARPFAMRGLRKLDAADFRHDYEIFLNEDGVVGKVLVALAEEVRTLDGDELKALVEAYVRPEHQADMLRHLRTFQNTEQPVREALPKLLDDLWRLEIRRHVQRALEHLHDAGVIKNTLRNRRHGPAVRGQVTFLSTASTPWDRGRCGTSACVS
jgi:hypothetical protein